MAQFMALCHQSPQGICPKMSLGRLHFFDSSGHLWLLKNPNILEENSHAAFFLLLWFWLFAVVGIFVAVLSSTPAVQGK